MRTATLDHEQIRLMNQTGFTAKQIADRLQCSERHARRIAGPQPNPNPLIGTDRERDLWMHYAQLGEMPAQIARRFGRTRQAVHAALNQ